MRLQYPVNAYWRKGNCAVNGAHTPFRMVALDRVNPLSYKGCVEEPSPLVFRTVSIIYGASVYVIDDTSGNCWRCEVLNG